MDISLLGAALATGVGSLVTAFFYRSVNEAKVKSIIGDTYDKLVGTLTNQVKTLENDVERLRNRLDILSQKELQYLQTITELTKERNRLQLAIIEKENVIADLQREKNIKP